MAIIWGDSWRMPVWSAIASDRLRSSVTCTMPNGTSRFFERNSLTSASTWELMPQVVLCLNMRTGSVSDDSSIPDQSSTLRSRERVSGLSSRDALPVGNRSDRRSVAIARFYSLLLFLNYIRGAIIQDGVRSDAVGAFSERTIKRRA